MDEKYGAFVALAALEGHLHLQGLLNKYDVDPNREIIDDAARFGQQRALERMFPGLVRSPFARKPLADINLALRYMYEEDPEGVLAMVNDETSRRQLEAARLGRKACDAPTERFSSSANALPGAEPARTKSDTGWRRMNAETSGTAGDTSWRVARASTNLSDTSVRRLRQGEETSKYQVAPAANLGPPARTAPAEDAPTPRPAPQPLAAPNGQAAALLADEIEDFVPEAAPAPEPAAQRDPAMPPKAPIASTKLQKIGGPAVFPWERKRQRSA